MKQIIISVGREFGSGGHIVAQKIAEHYDIPIFNKELLEEMARKEGYSEKALEKYDEKPVNFGFMPLPYAGGNIPIEQEIAMKQFEFIKNKADAGESFVIVGRCADYALSEYKDCFSVFVHADLDWRINRLAAKHNKSPKEAKDMITKTDKSRASYYNYYTNKKWGAAKSYNLCIDSSKLGIENSVRTIIEAIKIFDESKNK